MVSPSVYTEETKVSNFYVAYMEHSFPTLRTRERSRRSAGFHRSLACILAPPVSSASSLSGRTNHTFCNSTAGNFLIIAAHNTNWSREQNLSVSNDTSPRSQSESHAVCAKPSLKPSRIGFANPCFALLLSWAALRHRALNMYSMVLFLYARTEFRFFRD